LKVFPQFKRVAMHRDPHADEILAQMMLEDVSGRKVFPNLNPNNVEYVDRNELPNDRTFRQRPACIHLGCGGDPRFDEHVHENSKWEAACTLVGRATGHITHPAWVKTIEDVRREDRHGAASNGEIAWMVKLLYQSHGAEETIRWARLAYNAEIKSMRELWNEIKASEKNPKKRRETFARTIEGMKPLSTKTAKLLLRKQGSEEVQWFEQLVVETLELERFRRKIAVETFLSKAKCYSIERRHDRLRMFVVKSDNVDMASVSWGKFKGDIIVIQRENGHVAILTRTALNLNLKRLQEELIQIEPVQGATWVLAGEGGKLLNGSLKFTGVIPTGLSLEDLASVIQRMLGKRGSEFGRGLAFMQFEEDLSKLVL